MNLTPLSKEVQIANKCVNILNHHQSTNQNVQWGSIFSQTNGHYLQNKCKKDGGVTREYDLSMSVGGISETHYFIQQIYTIFKKANREIGL